MIRGQSKLGERLVEQGPVLTAEQDDALRPVPTTEFVNHGRHFDGLWPSPDYRHNA